jgi:hypothetical protein
MVSKNINHLLGIEIKKEDIQIQLYKISCIMRGRLLNAFKK